MNGKIVTLYLKEGITSGIVEGVIDNWNGRVIRIPWGIPDIDKLKDANDMGNMSVYVLFKRGIEGGEGGEGGEANIAYIGQSREIFDRLSQHLIKKTDYEQLFIITNDSNRLTKSHIEYLEARLIQLARTTGQVDPSDNKTNPAPNDLSVHQSVIDEMETFIENLRILLPMMGLDFVIDRKVKMDIERSSEPAEFLNIEEDKTPLFIIKKSGIKAYLQGIGKKLFIIEGSEAVKTSSHSFGSYKKQRDLLVEQGILRDEGQLLVFNRTVEFRSSSQASATILGRSSNGYDDWVIEGDPNTSYGDYLGSINKTVSE